MVTECQQVMTVHPLGQAALDRPLVVVSQNSRPPVAVVTFPAQHQQVSQSSSRHLIQLSTPIQAWFQLVSVMAHDAPWYSRQKCIPEGSVHRHSGLRTPASRRLRSSPQRPFHVGDGFSRPTPVLCQSSKRSRAKYTSLAPSKVFEMRTWLSGQK